MAPFSSCKRHLAEMSEVWNAWICLGNHLNFSPINSSLQQLYGRVNITHLLGAKLKEKVNVGDVGLRWLHCKSNWRVFIPLWIVRHVISISEVKWYPELYAVIAIAVACLLLPAADRAPNLFPSLEDCCSLACSAIKKKSSCHYEECKKSHWTLVKLGCLTLSTCRQFEINFLAHHRGL